MPTKRKSPGNEIYQIKVTLMRTAPPIWRRLLVSSDITLSRLHDLLQFAMGWTDSHMHEFQFRGQCYGSTDLAEGIDERNVRLNQVLARVGGKLVYAYDFGDGWEHGVVLEKCLPVGANMSYPACTGGRGACPPEDCGGIGGFHNLLEALQNPRHPNHQQLLEWVGRTYDPESSPSRQSTVSYMEESARFDLRVENISLWPGRPSANAPESRTHAHRKDTNDLRLCSKLGSRRQLYFC